MADKFLRKAQEIAEEIRAKMGACAGDAGEARTARVRSTAAEILELLTRNGLTITEHIKGRYLAVHPANRSGVGALPADVHGLLLRIVSDGFVWLECQGKIWGFQPQPGKDGKEQVAFNERLAARARGLLAEPGDDVRCLTIAGTHTTQGARCVEEETLGIPPVVGAAAAGSAAARAPAAGSAAASVAAPASRLDLWDSSGHLSKAKVLAANPAYGELLAKGPEVLAIRWQVEKAIPELPSFLSEAANAGHGVERKASTVQSMLRIAQTYEMTDGGVAEDARWSVVRAGGADADLVAFVQRWSGGTGNPFLLHELEGWCQCLPFITEISSRVLGQLAKLQGTTDMQALPIPGPEKGRRDSVTVLGLGVPPISMGDPGGGRGSSAATAHAGGPVEKVVTSATCSGS